MGRPLRAIAALLCDRHGATAIEYALLAGLIAVGLVVAMTTLGGSVTASFERYTADMEAAQQP